MKNAAFAVIAAVAAASAVPAAAEDFTGPYIQTGAGVTRGGSEIDFSAWFRDEVDDTDFNGVVAAGYAQSFGRFTVGANITHVLGGQSAGRTVQDFPGNPAEKGDIISVRISDMWSVNLEPGIHVGARGLAYGKVGYAWANGDWKFARPFFGDSTTGRMKLKGYSLGAGYKHDVGHGLFAFTEVQKTWFKQEEVPVTVVTSGVTTTYLDRYDTSSASAVAGFGFRF